MPSALCPSELRRRGITDARVLAAMATVPRDRFVRPEDRADALADGPLPIGFGQTISQPFIVAWMTQALRVEPTHRVLEIGTGSGYQTAVLAELVAEVVSLEVIPELSARARHLLLDLGVGEGRAALHVASGYAGWPDAAPFDRILLTAAPAEIPAALLGQLVDGGRLVGPVGLEHQVIAIVDRRGDEFIRETSLAVRFVPMV